MAYTISSEYGLFVVADGLGGHDAGEKASKYFCQGLFKVADKYQGLLQKCPSDRIKDVFQAWVNAAIDEMKVFFAGASEGENSHTTCVILYLDKNMTVTAHCGDSRIYRLNEKQVLWRTKDHSIIQDHFNDGNISEREMGLHPEQNQLLRTINIQKRHQVEVNIYPVVEKGETFVLCSDGFWEFTKEHEFVYLANEPMQKSFLLRQAKMALFRASGKADNLTVQWVRVGE